jgi:hypothetical protein
VKRKKTPDKECKRMIIRIISKVKEDMQKMLNKFKDDKNKELERTQIYN